MSDSAHLQTPSQTVGPYFTMRLSGEGDNVLTTPDSVGQRIRIEGRVLDGDRANIAGKSEDEFVAAITGARA